MFRPPTNLNRFVLWTDVLSALHIDFPAEALPCVVRCPSCGNSQLVIYQDTTDDGQWHHCKSCNQAGDMIQLAMRVLNLDLADTVAHLSDLIPSLKTISPTDAEINKYGEVLTRQKNVHIFLTENRSNFSSSRVLMPFRLLLGTSTVARSDWGARGGDFMVSATREQVDAFIGNNPTDSIFQGRGNQSKDWKEVVVIPFHDLPGRVSAMQFCYLHDKTISPFHYRSLLHCADMYMTKQPGIALFHALERSDPALGDDLFVFTDVVAALRLQIHKLKDGMNLPMPLVAVNIEAKPSAYIRDHCPSRRIIFWAQQLSVQFFKHVKAANGWVADHRPGEDMFHFLNRFTPLQLVSHLRKVARPWEAVLEDFVANLSLVELTAFMLRLDWTDDDLDHFINSCAGPTRQRLCEIRTKQRQYRRVTLNNHCIMETQRGWQLAKTDEVISEVVFYLEKIIHYEDGRHFYHGKARYGDKLLDFTAPARAFNARPLQWLRDFFIQNDAGAPSFLKSWQTSALSISERFQTPKTMPGLDRCGWDDRRSCFMILDHALRVGGDVEKHDLPPPDPLRCVKLPHPGDFNSLDVELLSDSSYSTELCWAMAGCILHDVLARVYRYETSGLMLTGHGAENMIKIAKELGCPSWSFDIVHRDWPGNEVLIEAERRAAWPILMPIQLTHTTHPRLWLRGRGHNSIVHVDWGAAHTHMICSRWKYIDAQHALLDHQVIQATRRAIPAFLQALTARQMLPWHQPGAGQLAHIFANLASWFKERGGKASVLNHAYLLTRFDEDGLAASMFFELLAFLYTEGRITSYRSECVPKRKQCPSILYLSDNPDLIWVPKPGLNLALSGRQRQLTIDLNSVSLALADDGKLIDEREIDGTPGWVVPKSAWEVALKQREKSKARKFGVVR